MNSDDKSFVWCMAIIASAVVAGFCTATVASAHERYTDRMKFEAAAKAGLVQKIDPVTQKTYWTKPTE